MIVSIHQPNFFPWLGFFDKMAKSDLFIFLDDVQFTKGGFQNRVKLKGANGPQWLTVPVFTKGMAQQPTNRVSIDGKNDWKKKHLHTLSSLYSGTANFSATFDRLSEIYSQDDELLVDFTLKGIEHIQNCLGIQTSTLKSSALNINENRTKLLVMLVKEVGGTVYLSGPSGRNYLDENLFKAEKIALEYHEFHEEPYSQKFAEFTRGLSALDYLFNVKVGSP